MRRLILPLVGCTAILGLGGLLPLGAPGPGYAQQPPAQQDDGATAASAAPDGEADPTKVLQAKRDQINEELQALSRTMALSSEKTASLEASIAALAKTTENLRTALIASATRRKDLEQKIADSEKRLAGLSVREDRIKASFKERRAMLAEVLGALQRMGRNPPPALLVSPEDALGSVRSAILLGAVVPGIRRETDRLADDLAELVRLRKAGQEERASLVTTMESRQEEERRMDMLIVENDKLSQRNNAELEAERKRSEELARQAGNLQGLIGSLESEIGSVREAMEKARAEQQRQQQLSEEQREKARQQADAGLPEKNRIAPAQSFAELKGKLDLPATGDVLRAFGDPDGTGHQTKGMIVAASAGGLVTAPGDGLVVFAGQFRSYGQMIILNMGEGYHVVLAGMDRIETRQGKFVLAGEPLAVMGEKRVASAMALALETERPTLYIEFRKDGEPVDSRPWWKKKDAGKAGNDT